MLILILAETDFAHTLTDEYSKSIYWWIILKIHFGFHNIMMCIMWLLSWQKLHQKYPFPTKNMLMLLILKSDLLYQAIHKIWAKRKHLQFEDLYKMCYGDGEQSYVSVQSSIMFGEGNLHLRKFCLRQWFKFD